MTDPLEDAHSASKRHAGRKKQRGAFGRDVFQRRSSRQRERQNLDVARNQPASGWPEMEGLKPVMMFLSMPALLVLAITVTGGHWPSYILFPIALGLGLIVAISAFRGVELILACLLIYLPFSKVFVVPIAPGVNGTNMLVLLGLFAALLRLYSTRQKLTEWPPGSVLVFAFGVLSCASAFTIMQIPGGRVFLLYNEFLSYKAWVDQFIFYFIVLMCVRDEQTAKRCVLYIMLGSILVVLYAVPEMLEKQGRSTIDKSRIGGPHLQSNNFGGFVAYTLLPLVAVFILYIRDIRAWLLTPYFLLTVKVLITTFSRGAYVAMVIGGFMAGWFKGRGFVLFWVSVFLCFFLVFPSFVPDSIKARMGSLTSEQSSALSTEDSLDRSSSIRLMMWRAASEMILEDPIWGKGFKGFQLLKDEYTEFPVIESDPHNMYLYIGSQMGLPALSLFLLILGYSFYLGRMHSKNKDDQFIRAIGIGGAAATACFAVVCMFGSRAVTLNFTVYFWTILVVMQVLKKVQTDAQLAAKAKAKRGSAFDSLEQQNPLVQDESMDPELNLAASQPNGQKRYLARKTGKSQRRRGATRGAAAHQASLADQQCKQSGNTAKTTDLVESLKQPLKSDTAPAKQQRRAFRKKSR